MRTQSICLAFVFDLLCPTAFAQWTQVNIGLADTTVNALAVGGPNLFVGRDQI